MPVLSSEDQRMEDYSSDIDEEYDHREEEESGWTSYLIDFEIMNQRERELKEEKMMIMSNTDDQSGGGSSSYSHSVVVPLPRKLKTIKKKVSDFEDPFEDTATSPHSSPKVSTLMIDDGMDSMILLQTKTKMKGRSKNDKTGSPLGKGDRWYFHDQDQEMRSRSSTTAGYNKEEIRGIDEEMISCDIDDCCISTTT